MAGQRRGFLANAFHHVAVAAEGVNVVVENLEAGPVVVGRQPIGGNRHAHAVSDALTERAGRGFDAGSPAVFGMAGSLAVELAELLDVVET